MKDLKLVVKSKAITWMCRSPWGNVVLFELIFSLPAFGVFSYLDYINKIISVGRLLLVLSVCSLNGIFLGLIIWILVTRPAVKSKERRMSASIVSRK